MPEQVYELRITLLRSKPPIWRKVAVTDDMTLGGLHRLIQIVMGWEDDHLHHFVTKGKPVKLTDEEAMQLILQGRMNDLRAQRGERCYTGCAPDGSDTDMEGEDENGVTLADIFSTPDTKLTYEYDFGDSWQHSIELKKTYPPKEGVAYPVCLEGKMACPPEDCGGVWGYYEKLASLADPTDEYHEDAKEWFGEDFDPEALDLDRINAALTYWRKAQSKSKRRR